MNMRIILTMLCCLCMFAFAETREMRIGDSQYFKSQESGKMVKVTLIGVENGVAILKKENVENIVESIDYFYFAPTNSTVAPISLQPYPKIVYDSNILFEASVNLVEMLWCGKRGLINYLIIPQR